ncbi:hypothetical protein [Acidocella facilis]|uniref:hypothetical protein n=1 Tax=Acidocella facilis TaxID=525 RepID=UPI001F1EAE52|nr:hypothetical protein [Acidocella facilis]
MAFNQVPVQGLYGEAHCDADWVLHGWCWNPATPSVRLTAELTIRGVMVRSVLASRFREDLRDRGVGDGYYAFNIIIPQEARPAAAGGGGMHAALSIADANHIFWQINALKLPIPEQMLLDLASHRSAIKAAVEQIAPKPSSPTTNRRHAKLAESVAALRHYAGL